jgi:hypothetical protein
MYLDSSPTIARRSAQSRRRACVKPAPRPRSRPVATSARPRHLDDAIVAQWLLDQVPAGHRHARPALA